MYHHPHPAGRNVLAYISRKTSQRKLGKRWTGSHKTPKFTQPERENKALYNFQSKETVHCSMRNLSRAAADVNLRQCFAREEVA